MSEQPDLIDLNYLANKIHDYATGLGRYFLLPIAHGGGVERFFVYNGETVTVSGLLYMLLAFQEASVLMAAADQEKLMELINTKMAEGHDLESIASRYYMRAVDLIGQVNTSSPHDSDSSLLYRLTYAYIKTKLDEGVDKASLARDLVAVMYINFPELAVALSNDLLGGDVELQHTAIQAKESFVVRKAQLTAKLLKESTRIIDENSTTAAANIASLSGIYQQDYDIRNLAPDVDSADKLIAYIEEVYKEISVIIQMYEQDRGVRSEILDKLRRNFPHSENAGWFEFTVDRYLTAYNYAEVNEQGEVISIGGRIIYLFLKSLVENKGLAAAAIAKKELFKVFPPIFFTEQFRALFKQEVAMEEQIEQGMGDNQDEAPEKVFSIGGEVVSEESLTDEICNHVGAIIYPGEKKAGRKIKKDIESAARAIIAGEQNNSVIKQKLAVTSGRCAVEENMSKSGIIVLSYKFQKKSASIYFEWKKGNLEVRIYSEI